MHRDLVDLPTFTSAANDSYSEGKKKIVGSFASDIYISLRNGAMYGKVTEAVKLVEKMIPNGVGGHC